MSNDVEKKEGKQEPEVKEATQQEVDSKPKGDVKPKSKSEVDDKKAEEIIKSQTGIIQSLQRKVEELEKKPDAKEVLKSLLGDEQIESDVDPIDAVKTQLQTLQSKLDEKEANERKNATIDELADVPEVVKRELKRRIPANAENMEEAVSKELEAIESLSQGLIPRTTDSRPTHLGAGQPDRTDANYILEHPEQFNK